MKKDWYYTKEQAEKKIGQRVVIDRLRHITDNTVIASDIKQIFSKKLNEEVDTGILRYVGDRDNPENDRIFLKYSANATPIFSYYLPHERFDEERGVILSGFPFLK